MKIISWNICSGQSTGKEENNHKVKETVAKICEENADVIVLQEANDDFKEILKNELGKNYRVYMHNEFTKSNAIKVLVAYKNIDEDVDIYQYSKKDRVDFAYARWIELSYKGIEIVGLHAPWKYGQLDFWKQVKKYAKENSNKNVLLIGDFNVYEKTAFYNSPSKAFADFKVLQNSGWQILKTERIDDYSYCNSGRWDRQLDYALVSPTFKYKYTLKMIRFEKLSDHEMLVVQLDI